MPVTDRVTDGVTVQVTDIFIGKVTDGVSDLVTDWSNRPE